MKKWMTFGLSLALTGILVGCGKSDQASEAKSSSKQETITYALWDTNQEAGMKEMAKKFEEKNKDIKVKVEVTPWDQYWTKLDAAATGGSLPDVFWMHSNEAYRYMSNEILLPLDDSIKAKKIDLANYPEDISKLYSYKDSQYAIPKDIDTIGLWYNKTLFDEAGIAYPDENWTWETLKENAKKLTDPAKKVYGLVLANDGQEGYWNFIFQNEGKIFNDDRTKSEMTDPKTQEALQFYADLIDKEKVSPSSEQMSENKPASYIQSGRAAMGLFGSWMLADFKANDYMLKNMDVAVLPKGKKQASIYNGLGNAVAASSQHKEAAVKFVEYLSSEEANVISAEMGSAIPAYKGTAGKWVDNTKEYDVQVYLDMMDYAVIRPYSKETIKVERVETDQLAELFNGKKPVNEVTEKIKTEVDQILK
ncbi:extracellular solute-binding protein [Vagococcus sp.]|uniref:ABC transporter substrate-binding protein n=1 Tax=Vagococcus sp. TaxID=1933889 RepID=UPI003F950759